MDGEMKRQTVLPIQFVATKKVPFFFQSIGSGGREEVLRRVDEVVVVDEG